MSANLAELLDSKYREYYVKKFIEQAPLLVELMGPLKSNPLSKRHLARLDREHKLEEFAQLLHTLACGLGAHCEHPDE